MGGVFMLVLIWHTSNGRLFVSTVWKHCSEQGQSQQPQWCGTVSTATPAKLKSRHSSTVTSTHCSYIKHLCSDLTLQHLWLGCLQFYVYNIIMETVHHLSNTLMIISVVCVYDRAWCQLLMHAQIQFHKSMGQSSILVHHLRRKFSWWRSLITCV